MDSVALVDQVIALPRQRQVILGLRPMGWRRVDPDLRRHCQRIERPGLAAPRRMN